MVKDIIITGDTIKEIVGQEVAYATDPEFDGDQKMPKGITEEDIADAFIDFCREDVWEFLCKEAEIFFGEGMAGVEREVKAQRKKEKKAAKKVSK